MVMTLFDILFLIRSYRELKLFLTNGGDYVPIVSKNNFQAGIKICPDPFFLIIVIASLHGL